MEFSSVDHSSVRTSVTLFGERYFKGPLETAALNILIIEGKMVERIKSQNLLRLVETLL